MKLLRKIAPILAPVVVGAGIAGFAKYKDKAQSLIIAKAETVEENESNMSTHEIAKLFVQQKIAELYKSGAIRTIGKSLLIENSYRTAFGTQLKAWSYPQVVEKIQLSKEEKGLLANVLDKPAVWSTVSLYSCALLLNAENDAATYRNQFKNIVMMYEPDLGERTDDLLSALYETTKEANSVPKVGRKYFCLGKTTFSQEDIRYMQLLWRYTTVYAVYTVLRKSIDVYYPEEKSKLDNTMLFLGLRPYITSDYGLVLISKEQFSELTLTGEFTDEKGKVAREMYRWIKEEASNESSYSAAQADLTTAGNQLANFLAFLIKAKTIEEKYGE